MDLKEQAVKILAIIHMTLDRINFLFDYLFNGTGLGSMSDMSE
jgi:hypothetical protein